MAISLARRMPIVLPGFQAVAADLAAWRGSHPQLAAHLALGVAPAHALRHLGLSAWSQGDTELAATTLKAAAALAPGDASLWTDLSGVYAACAKPREARACLMMALERDDRNANRWLSLAGLYRETREDDEAEEAFRRASALDPSLHDAWVGLGILQFQHRRFALAVEALRRAIGLGSRNIAVHACLGEALYLQGDIAGAAEAYARQVELTPGETKIVQKFAFLGFLDALIRGPLEEALIAYRAAAGVGALESQVVIQNAFHALSGYGYTEAAMRCGRARLAHAPDDPIPRYLMAALEGVPVARAPDDYLIRTFDQFADSFDHKLVDVLDYRIPEKMQQEIAALGGFFDHSLDAGCGTGLAGPLLRSAAGRLTGIDLSSRMLAKAAKRGVYDRLVEAEIHDFLGTTEERFDLIFAADVLIYVGDLGALMASVARSLSARGIFAFSVETTEAADYLLLPSGRFAHRTDYVAQASRGLFSIEKSLATQIRLDAQRPALGMIFLLRKIMAA
jgi:predicted TPR repeat methyltransferase